MRAAAHKPTAALLALLFVPLLWSLGQALLAGLDSAAWVALWQDSQTRPALATSLWTGLASASLATASAAWLLSRSTGTAALSRLQGRQGWQLAVPHAAFAMGLALWIAPSGWLLRALSPWATGMQAPPPWPTTQDPWGLGLIAVLALKEIPFLLWAASAELLRPDVAQRLQRELQLAASLGYSAHSAWWRIVWPQLLARLGAPLLAVLAYSLTVVDVALVIGPASPPTLAVLAWQWLQDASSLSNAKGAAAAWALAASVAASAGLAWLLLNAPLWRHLRTRGAAGIQAAPPGPHARLAHAWLGQAASSALAGIYLAVLAALLLGSLIGSWPFPAVWPSHWSSLAWHTVGDSSATLWTTLWLATASTSCALLWVVAWLEWAPARWQQHLQALAYAPLLLPGLLWAIGLHRLALAWGLDASAAGLWLAHTLACLPYVLLTSSAAYKGFDARYLQLAATLGQGRLHFLLHVKWPLLRAPLASAFAVGFAVSVAQYLPTLYVGGGRFASVTTEAVSLATGGQRSLMAAFAWLQWLLPALVFGAAAWLGRSRRFVPAAQPLGTITA
jgi:putative thiamine transport system permease protein